MRLKRSKGEMVEVEGGRIIRSLGRKDRHSKVCTSKGPRDRRVRLSADAAIQFYDVQDRLGYDRPSKAIDWLMKEAKAAIDALNENQLELPVNASFYNPSQAFNRTPGEGIQNGQNFNNDTFGFFDNYPDLHLSLQEKPIPQQENLFSASNTVEQYFIGQNQLFAHDREHLQSSFPPSIQAAINGFDNDDEFLGFPFPQEIQGKEEDQVSSGISLLHYQ